MADDDPRGCPGNAQFGKWTQAQHKNTGGGDLDNRTGNKVFRRDLHVAGGTDNCGKTVCEPHTDNAPEQHIRIGQCLFQNRLGAAEPAIDQGSTGDEYQRSIVRPAPSQAELRETPELPHLPGHRPRGVAPATR